jgi:pyruvate dehydrogenase E2 component (dihydrolipoamide acetyltransferase)
MANEVILPMLGETMNEGTIVSWQKVEGEAVRQGEVLFTVESDKATLEVEAPASGVLRKILAPAGTAVPVLAVIGWIAETMDEPVPDASGVAPAGSTPAPPTERAGAGALRESALIEHSGRVFASPRARRAARERGLDLSRLRPSGSAGRIVERDVLSALVVSEARSTPIAERVARELGVDLAGVVGTGRSGLITRQDVERAARAPKTAAPELQPLTRTQRLMAERMTASFTSAPHFYLHVEVNARALLTLRQELLPAVEAEAHVRLTMTDILIRLCALALVKHP